jgi:hypothetical protein
MRRLGADFFFLARPARWAPTIWDPFSVKGGGSLFVGLIRRTENRPHWQIGGALGIVGPGSKAQSEAQRFADAVPHGQQKSADKNSAKQGRCAIAAACRSNGVARLVDAHGRPRHGRGQLARLQVGVSVAAVSERPLQYSSARGTVRPWPFNDSRHASRKGRPLGARQMGFRDG